MNAAAPLGLLVVLMAANPAHARPLGAFSDTEAVKPELSWDDVDEPALALATLRVVDDRPRDFERFPDLVGHDVGLGFNPLTIVHKEVNGILLRGVSVSGWVEHVVVSGARRAGLDLTRPDGNARPRLRVRIRELWCDEPGDDNQRCRLTARVALHRPSEDEAVWSRTITSRFSGGQEEERVDSYEDLLRTFQWDVHDALLEDGVVELLVRDPSAAPWVPPPPPPPLRARPEDWLEVRDAGGGLLTGIPAGAPLFGRPLGNVRPGALRIYMHGARKGPPLSTAEVVELLGDPALSAAADRAVSRFVQKRDAGVGMSIAAGILGGTAAGIIGVQRGLHPPGSGVSWSDPAVAAPIAISSTLVSVAIPLVAIGLPVAASGEVHRRRILDGDLAKVTDAELLLEAVDRHNRERVLEGVD